MTVQEMLIKAKTKLRKHNINKDISINYTENGVWEVYVIDNEAEFWADGFTLEEALYTLIYDEGGINSIDELVEEDRKQKQYENRIYWEKQTRIA